MTALPIRTWAYIKKAFRRRFPATDAGSTGLVRSPDEAAEFSDSLRIRDFSAPDTASKPEPPAGTASGVSTRWPFTKE